LIIEDSNDARGRLSIRTFDKMMWDVKVMWHVNVYMHMPGTADWVSLPLLDKLLDTIHHDCGDCPV